MSILSSRSKTSSNIYNLDPPGRSTTLDKIYVGFVKQVYDQQYMGRLKVWIPELGGDVNDENSYFIMNYASPFAGATPWTETNPGTDYTDSQRSYGMWFVPPDVENEVLCCFINGDPGRGIWFACLWQQYMNHMVPGIPGNNSSNSLPVGEYNKNDQINDIGNVTRPTYTPLASALERQGLSGDPIRGVSTSGARRVTPYGMAQGILTPGGTQFVLDDSPGNTFVRIRTPNGTQILINDTDGNVYMNSRDGNSWLELAADGSIDCYAANDLSVRTQGNMNLRADLNMNIEAGANINLRARAGSINADASTNLNLNSTLVTYITSGTDLNINTNGNRNDSVKLAWNRVAQGELTDASASAYNIKSNAAITVTGDTVTIAEGNAGTLPAAATSASVPVDKKQKDIVVTGLGVPTPLTYMAPTGPTGPTGVTYHAKTAPTSSNTAGITVVGKTTETICTSLPCHEPYAHSGDSAGFNNYVVRGSADTSIPTGAATPNAALPITVYGTPTPGKPEGEWVGVGYDSKGQPQYIYKGPSGKLNPASSYTTSDAGIALTETYESYPRGGLPYPDAHGELDVGYGHTVTSTENSTGILIINGQSVPFQNGITQEQSDALLRQDLRTTYEPQIHQAITANITQSQFDVLIDMAYNIGIAGFRGLIEIINSGNFQNVPNLLLQYDHYHTADGVLEVNNSLAARCQARAIAWSAGETDNGIS
jgi:GH24 family phage-related lysozyme (muramidase)